MRDISYSLVKKGLDVSSLRNRAINSNIVNFNTPDYKANKVRFEEVLTNSLGSLELRTTHMDHFGVASIDDFQPETTKRKTTRLNDNGNNVDVDLEMTELAANELYYSALVRQVSSKLSSLNYVINK